METLSIGKLSQKTGIGIEAIRFYEREGLMEKPARKIGSNYRQYDRGAIRRLRFILNAKSLGFSLKEIRDLLYLRASSITQCSSIKKKAQQKIEQIQKKISDLTRIQRALTQVVSVCHDSMTTSKCPILDFISEGELPTKEEK